MRCPDCNKFVGMDDSAEPEEQSCDVSEDGAVAVEVRIVNCCADCGTELKEANLNLEGEFDEDAMKAAGDEPELRIDESERTSRSEGKGRGTRTYYGASVKLGLYRADAKPDAAPVATLELSDDVQASDMDELA